VSLDAVTERAARDWCDLTLPGGWDTADLATQEQYRQTVAQAAWGLLPRTRIVISVDLDRYLPVKWPDIEPPADMRVLADDVALLLTARRTHGGYVLVAVTFPAKDGEPETLTLTLRSERELGPVVEMVVRAAVVKDEPAWS
jgi:hypothetical protein